MVIGIRRRSRRVAHLRHPRDLDQRFIRRRAARFVLAAGGYRRQAPRRCRDLLRQDERFHCRRRHQGVLEDPDSRGGLRVGARGPVRSADAGGSTLPQRCRSARLRSGRRLGTRAGLHLPGRRRRSELVVGAARSAARSASGFRRHGADRATDRCAPGAGSHAQRQALPGCARSGGGPDRRARAARGVARARQGTAADERRRGPPRRSSTSS